MQTHYPDGSAAPPPASGSGTLSDNVVGGVAYISVIPAIVFLLIEPYKRIAIVRFHCFQSIFLTVLSIVAAMVTYIPGLGVILGLVLQIFILVVWLIAMIQAFRGKKFAIPGLGGMAEQLAGRG